MNRMQEEIPEATYVTSKLVKNYFILMNIQINECEHCCSLRIKESLHLTGFLVFVHITCLLICFCLNTQGKKGEINGGSFFVL